MDLNASTLSHLASLVQAAIDDADQPAVELSVVARKALRIARLRGNWDVVWWLQLEMQTVKVDQESDGAALRASAEARANLTTEEFDEIGRTVAQRWIGGRKLSNEAFQHQGIPEAEAHASTLRRQLADLRPEVAGQSRDLLMAAAQLRTALRETESLLARLRNEIAIYLGEVERQLLLGRVSEDVWERNRTYVDRCLAEIAPQALEQFAAAYRRHAEGDREARSHALTSCRRVLKTLADALYPATNETVDGVDGRGRRMTDDKFVSRLCQFAAEDDGGSASKALLTAQVRSLGERLDSLNALSSKGVHDEVSASEVDQCLIQTYLTVGDLLRAAERQVASLPTASGSFTT